jgi:hypothetical protein
MQTRDPPQRAALLSNSESKSFGWFLLRLRLFAAVVLSFVWNRHRPSVAASIFYYRVFVLLHVGRFWKSASRIVHIMSTSTWRVCYFPVYPDLVRVLLSNADFGNQFPKSAFTI